MNSIKISRPYLEGLTTQELYQLGQSFGVNLAPGLNRPDVIEELLELIPCLALYQQNVPSPEPPPYRPRHNAPEIEIAPLVTHYNTTYINALVRDPFWIFVFWEINSLDKKRFETAAGFEGFVLRICLDNPQLPEAARVLYTTNIQEHDTGFYLNFPHDLEDSIENGRPARPAFIVELCRLLRGDVYILAATAPFSMPKSINQLYPANTDKPPPAILLLSGLDRIDVVRGAL